MNDHNTAWNHHLIDLLEQHGLTAEPIDPARRLLGQLPVGYPMVEFFSDQVGRAIALPADSPDIAAHQLLRTHGLPVFDEVTTVGGLRLLGVPLGTRPLASIIHLIRHDLAAYGSILSDIGRVQQLLLDSQIGSLVATDDRRILDRFAFVQEDESGAGASLALVPPYLVTQGAPADSLVTSVVQEFAAMSIFTAEELGYLHDLMVRGAEDAR